MLRLAIAAPTDFETLFFGGTLAYIREFLGQILYGRDWEIFLLGLAGGSSPQHSFARCPGGKIGYRFLPLGRARPGALLPVRSSYVWALLRNGSAIRALSLDAIYAHSAESALALHRILPKVPIILHCHGTANTIQRSRHWFARLAPTRAAYDSLVLRPGLRSSDRILVTADEAAFRDFSQRHGIPGSGAALRVPSMVDMERFRYEAEERFRRREVDKSFRIVAVGRVERVKGLDAVIRAVASLRRTGHDVKLQVIGDGSHRQALAHLAATLSLQGAVQFAGFQPREEIAGILREADAYVSGSRQEGFSVAMLEALASGLPVITTDVGGVREVVRQGINGWVAEPESSDQIAQGIQWAIEMGPDTWAACRESVTPYSSRTISDRIALCIEEAVAIHRRTRVSELSTVGAR